MNPETIITVIPTMFHAAVMGLGIVVLTYLQKIHRYQQRLVRSRSERPSDEQRIAHLQRIVDAAEDWYDDKKGSKERLREVVAQHRGVVPFRLVQRVTDETDCPECANGVSHEKCRTGWLDATACHICGARGAQPCDAGLHG